MAGDGPGDLFALADEFLNHCADALDTIAADDPTLQGAPDRQLVSPGQPVFDCCDQLAVEITLTQDADTQPLGLAAGKRATFGRIPLVTLAGWATRCIPSIVDTPTGGIIIPTAEELHESGRQLAADAWSLYNHLFNVQQSGQFRTLCSEVFFVGVTPVLPSGGCGGNVVTIRAQLDGYPVDFGS